MKAAAEINTLKFNPALCKNCGLCMAVCPHGVFERKNKQAALVNQAACMECGACSLNCSSGAITVESGVGCATAMIFAALTGKKEPTCGDATQTTPSCSTSEN